MTVPVPWESSHRWDLFTPGRLLNSRPRFGSPTDPRSGMRFRWCLLVWRHDLPAGDLEYSPGRKTAWNDQGRQEHTKKCFRGDPIGCENAPDPRRFALELGDQRFLASDDLTHFPRLPFGGSPSASSFDVCLIALSIAFFNSGSLEMGRVHPFPGCQSGNCSLLPQRRTSSARRPESQRESGNFRNPDSEAFRQK